MCGEIGYIATFMGEEIDENSSPVAWDPATQAFIIFTEDAALLGEQEITLTGFLVDFPSNKSTPQVASIVILDPCL